MATEVPPPPLSSLASPPAPTLTPTSSHSHHSFEHSPSTQNGVSVSSYPPPPPVVVSSSVVSASSAAVVPATSDRTFSEYLHDHFDAVFKRVTMGRRDLKAVHTYLSQRAQTEKQYADRIGKEAHSTPELADSSSAVGVWTAVKEQAGVVAAQHSQLASVCVELSTAVDKTVREMKTTKTSLQQRYNKLVDDCKVKQQKHDKARDAYGEAVKQTEQAIQQRDSGRQLPPQQQQKLDTQVSRQLAVLNGKHEEYKRAVQVLKDAQVNYDAQIIEIMQQFERTEQDRLAALHAHLQRYGQQHETLAAADVAVAQALLRSIATIDNRRDIQEYISATTTHTKPRPHIEYHAINSVIIEQNGNRAKMAPSGPPVAPAPVGMGMGMVQQPPQPPSQQQFGMPAQAGGVYTPNMQQQFKQPQPVLQPAVVAPSNMPPPPTQLQQPAAQSPNGAKFTPPPITVPFVPPPVNYVTSSALALYDFESSEPDDLTFKAGDVIVLKESEDKDDWWTGELRGKTGIFPKTYVQKQQPEGAVASSVLVPNALHTQQPAADVPQTTQLPAVDRDMQPSAHSEAPVGLGALSAGAAAAAGGSSDPAAAPEQPREMDARCEALFDFVGQDVDELSFKKGDQLVITGELNGWYLGKIENTQQVGIFPSNYVSVYP